MALGEPVISTSIGAEGLRVISGENVIIADEVDGFAKETIRWLQMLTFELGWVEAVENLSRIGTIGEI